MKSYSCLLAICFVAHYLVSNIANDFAMAMTMLETGGNPYQNLFALKNEPIAESAHSIHSLNGQQARNGPVPEPFSRSATKHHQQQQYITPEQMSNVQRMAERVKFVNSMENQTWKAKTYVQLALLDEESHKMLYGTILPETMNNGAYTHPPPNNKKQAKPQRKRRDAAVDDGKEKADKNEDDAFPVEFDVRKQWPECADVVNEVTDQGICGSCWAVSSASVLSDRMCISKAKSLRERMELWEQLVEKIQHRGCVQKPWPMLFHHWIIYIWLHNREVFELDGGDPSSANSRETTRVERMNLQKAWYNPLITSWLHKNANSDKEQAQKTWKNSMYKKLALFEKWFDSIKCIDASNTDRWPITKEKTDELRAVWCKTVNRTLDDQETAILAEQKPLLEARRFVQLLQELQNKDANVAKKLQSVQETLLEVLTANELGNKLKTTMGYTHVEIECLAQEVMWGGQWAQQLSMPAIKAQDGIQELANNLALWQQLVHSRWLGPSLMAQKMENLIAIWRDEMLDTFKQTAAAPKNMMSAYDMLTCVKKENSHNVCSTGGSLVKGFEYVKTVGLVSGTNRQRNAGCKPYRLTGIFNSVRYRAIERYKGLLCEPGCDQGWPSKEKLQMKKKIQSYVYTDVDAMGGHNALIKLMMEELSEYGSVVIIVRPSITFEMYGSGIYKAIKWIDNVGRLMISGCHAMRLIGWGEEDGVKYWRVVNSWGTGWGDNGMMRLVRGQNEIGVEETLAYPILD